MKKFNLFLTVLIVNCTLFIGSASAQWWTSGGNLLWPYGDVIISNGNLKVAKSLIGAHGPTWDFEHQRQSINDASRYNLVYWIDGTIGNDNFDGKTNATAYKTLSKIASVLPNDLEGNDAYIIMPAGQTITLTQNTTFNTKNGRVFFIWAGSWIDSVNYNDADKFGYWLNPDSSSHKNVNNNGQVLINHHGYNLTLTGNNTIEYIFLASDLRKPWTGATNMYKYYYNRFVFYTDVTQSYLMTISNCKFYNNDCWGMELRLQNVTDRGMDFSNMQGGNLNGFRILGHSGFNAVNDWRGAIVFFNNSLAFTSYRTWNPSGYYHPSYTCPVGNLINWDIEAMGQRQLFCFELGNYGNYDFSNMAYTQGAISETGLPFMWFNYNSLANNTVIYNKTKLTFTTDRASAIHTFDEKSTNKVTQFINSNLKQDADTLKVTKYFKFENLPNDSTNLKKGMLYFDRLTGVVKRKY